MSDQSQEWTPEKIEMEFKYRSQRDFFEHVADAHNAALAAVAGQVAAEERRANDSIVENVRLMNALAAEREEVKQWQQRFEQAAADSYAYVQKLKPLVDALEWYAQGTLMTKVARDALAKLKEDDVEISVVEGPVP